MPESLSVSGGPLAELTSTLTSTGAPFEGKVFTFLLDEYENLDAIQQRVVNILSLNTREVRSRSRLASNKVGFELRQHLHPVNGLRLQRILLKSTSRSIFWRHRPFLILQSEYATHASMRSIQPVEAESRM